MHVILPPRVHSLDQLSRATFVLFVIPTSVSFVMHILEHQVAVPRLELASLFSEGMAANLHTCNAYDVLQ